MTEFSQLDRYFADLFAPKTAQDKEQLLELMASARKGHLCLHSLKDPSIQWAKSAPIIRDQNRLYLQRNWALETLIVEHVRRLQQGNPRFIPNRLETAPTLLQAQAEAIHFASSHSLTLISGGPGTGKTFTAQQLIQSFVNALPKGASPLRVKIAAPTGKAADRLAQKIPSHEQLLCEASTLHRLLRVYPGRSRLLAQKPIDADLILVDEASMIDAQLFAHLLLATPSDARLILLGDPDQLPPIEGGGVFADLADLFAIRLSVCHRTQEDTLHRLFDALREGDAGPLLEILEPLPKQFDLPRAAKPYLERPDPLSLIEEFDQMRLICPLRQGPVGVDVINRTLLLRQQKELAFGNWWAAPILATGNDHELKIYNGTPGVILARYEGGSLPRGFEMVTFPDGRSFPLHRLPGYELAYALSVHKSQGSEFDEVFCILPEGSEEFGKEALYTALTRAKKRVRLAGSVNILLQMISSKSRPLSGIQERLSRSAAVSQ